MGRAWSRRFLVGAILILLALPAAAGLASEQEQALARIDSLWTVRAAAPSLALIDSLLPPARAADDSTFTLQLLMRRGARARGPAPEMERVLLEAESLAVALGDSTSWRPILWFLATNKETQGDVQAALGHYRRLLELCVIADDVPRMYWAQVGVGWNELMAGNKQVAAEYYRSAIDGFHAMDDLHGELWARNGLGVVLDRMGDYEAAAELLEGTVEVARLHEDLSVEAMAQNNLGALRYDLGQPGLAMEHYGRARDIHREMGERRKELIPELNMAMCLLMLERREDAREKLLRIIERSREAGFREQEVDARLVLSKLARHEGHLQEAAEQGRLALAGAEGQDVDDWLECRLNLATVLRLLDKLPEAIRMLEETWEQSRGKVGSAQALKLLGQWALSLQRAGRHEEAVELFRDAMRLGRENQRHEDYTHLLAYCAGSLRSLGRVEEALDFYEEAVANWESNRALPLDPEWREHVSVAGHLLFVDYALTLHGHSGGEPGPAFEVLQRYKARTLMERMLGPGRRLEARRSEMDDTVGLEEFRTETLGEGELFLDFHMGPERSLVFVVGPEEAVLLELPSRDDLARRLWRFQELVTRPGSDVERPRRQVREDWFGEIAERLDSAERILLSPGGVTNLVPMELLLAGPGKSCIRVPSATMLARLRVGELPAPEAPSLLALANSDRGQDDYLPGAEAEARQLERRFRHVELRLLDAEEDAPGDSLLAGFDILHFANHVRIDDQNPWQSEIQLFGLHDKRNLRARQIAAMDLDARLAVLSSCESARGRAPAGEGVLGLSSAFISAGVPAVLATLWSVEDQSARRFMESFYAALAEGASTGQALESARAFLRSRPETAHPFYWAGYVLIGDGDLHLPLERSRFPLPGWQLALLILAGAVLGVLAARRIVR